MWVGDFKGHVGSDMDGFGEVHGDFGIGKINDGENRLLDWAFDKRSALDEYLFPEKEKSAYSIWIG